MSTRSRIGVMHGDKLKSVYCHWDGYLQHNGQLLQDHYDSAKANHLVSLGYISSLKEETGTDFTVDQTFEEFLSKDYDCEYYYIMRDGVWYVGVAYETDNMVPGQLYVLAEQLAKVEA